jgi:hypothetical protein
MELVIPNGWRKEVRQRKTGASAGKFDVYFYSPEGKKFRSSRELGSYLEEIGSALSIDEFDWGKKKPRGGASRPTTEKKPLPKSPVEKSPPQVDKKSPVHEVERKPPVKRKEPEDDRKTSWARSSPSAQLAYAARLAASASKRDSNYISRREMVASGNKKPRLAGTPEVNFQSKGSAGQSVKKTSTGKRRPLGKKAITAPDRVQARIEKAKLQLSHLRENTSTQSDQVTNEESGNEIENGDGETEADEKQSRGKENVNHNIDNEKIVGDNEKYEDVKLGDFGNEGEKTNELPVQGAWDDEKKSKEDEQELNDSETSSGSMETPIDDATTEGSRIENDSQGGNSCRTEEQQERKGQEISVPSTVI